MRAELLARKPPATSTYSDRIIVTEHFGSRYVMCPGLARRAPNRTALREEENRFLPPSQQVSASAVTGPSPYSRAASTFAPTRWRAASSSWRRSGASWASTAASMSSAVATCSCPAGDRCAAVAVRKPASPCPVRSAPLAQRRGALVEEHRMDPLHPGSVLGPQVVGRPPR